VALRPSMPQCQVVFLVRLSLQIRCYVGYCTQDAPKWITKKNPRYPWIRMTCGRKRRPTKNIEATAISFFLSRFAADLPLASQNIRIRSDRQATCAVAELVGRFVFFDFVRGRTVCGLHTAPRGAHSLYLQVNSYSKTWLRLRLAT